MVSLRKIGLPFFTLIAIIEHFIFAIYKISHFHINL